MPWTPGVPREWIPVLGPGSVKDGKTGCTTGPESASVGTSKQQVRRHSVTSCLNNKASGVRIPHPEKLGARG